MMPKVIKSAEAGKNLVALAEARGRDPKMVWGLSWGADFPALDRKTHGIQERKMLLLISRPSAGKSALAAKWALAVATQLKAAGEGKVVRVVTLEMSAESWQMRIGAFLADVPIWRIESGYATDEQRARFATAQATLATLPIEYLESANDLEEIKRFVGGDGNCGFWVLDHIGITPGIAGAFSTYQALQKASIQVTKLCHERVTGLILGHQNRMGAQGEDKRPTMESVAGADQISRDADLALGIYRADMFVRLPEEQAHDAKPGELLILKNRAGSQGTIFTIYSPTRTDWKEDPELNKPPKEEPNGTRPAP